MCVCVYIYIYTPTHIYIYMYICTHTHTHTHTFFRGWRIVFKTAEFDMTSYIRCNLFNYTLNNSNSMLVTNK
jgi:hypothetical protein